MFHGGNNTDCEGVLRFSQDNSRFAALPPHQVLHRALEWEEKKLLLTFQILRMNRLRAVCTGGVCAARGVFFHGAWLGAADF